VVDRPVAYRRLQPIWAKHPITVFKRGGLRVSVWVRNKARSTLAIIFRLLFVPDSGREDHEERGILSRLGIPWGFDSIYAELITSAEATLDLIKACGLLSVTCSLEISKEGRIDRHQTCPLDCRAWEYN